MHFGVGSDSKLEPVAAGRADVRNQIGRIAKVVSTMPEGRSPRSATSLRMP
jgi:hypothetical protein